MTKWAGAWMRQGTVVTTHSEQRRGFILDWQPTTVISYGRDYSILLPVDPCAWFLSGSLRNPACIAVDEQGVYICANGGPSADRFFQCFVEFATGRLVEDRLPGYAAYTNDWEIAFCPERLPPRTLLKYGRKESI
jgi:hypothetical protein